MMIFYQTRKTGPESHHKSNAIEIPEINPVFSGNHLIAFVSVAM